MTDTKSATTTSPEGSEQKPQTFKLDKFQELRFEVVGKEIVTMELSSGLGEMFGTELIKGKKYELYGGTKSAIFTWHGCSIDVTGNCSTMYVSGDTPMVFYANVHGALEHLRNQAQQDGKRGPLVLVVGPTDSGKATLSRILCNYAVRRGRCPVFIDFNVESNSIGVPGTIGVNVIERPFDIEEKSPPLLPGIFHFGYTSPDQNIPLYNSLITKIDEVVKKKMEVDRHVMSSGAIINTCSWSAQEEGYNTLLQIATAFGVDVILVFAMEKLCNDLKRDLPSSVKVILTPSSHGALRKSLAYRREMGEDRIRRYFYGAPKSSGAPRYFPHIFTVPIDDLKIYKATTLVIPSSCLPIGMENNTETLKFIRVTPDKDWRKKILAVSYANSPSEALGANAMGFISIANLDLEKKVAKVLSPQPAPLPLNKILLYSEIEYSDAD